MDRRDRLPGADGNNPDVSSQSRHPVVGWMRAPEHPGTRGHGRHGRTANTPQRHRRGNGSEVRIRPEVIGMAGHETSLFAVELGPPGTRTDVEAGNFVIRRPVAMSGPTAPQVRQAGPAEPAPHAADRRRGRETPTDHMAGIQPAQRRSCLDGRCARHRTDRAGSRLSGTLHRLAAVAHSPRITRPVTGCRMLATQGSTSPMARYRRFGYSVSVSARQFADVTGHIADNTGGKVRERLWKTPCLDNTDEPLNGEVRYTDDEARDLYFLAAWIPRKATR